MASDHPPFGEPYPLVPAEPIPPTVIPVDEEAPRPAIPEVREPAPGASPVVIAMVAIGLISVLGLIVGLAWWFWPSWEAYVCQEGNYGIMLPDKPESFVRETEVPGLKGKTKFYTMELDHDHFYVSAYADLPKEVEPTKDLLQTICYANFAGVFENVKVEPIPSGIIQDFKGKYPGLRYRFIVQNHGQVVMWVILVKHRLYVLMACGEEIEPGDEEVQKFLDSFDFYDDPE